MVAAAGYCVRSEDRRLAHRTVCVPARAALDGQPHGLLKTILILSVPVGAPCSCWLRRDIELLRVQILEEIEAPHKAKCDQLAKVQGTTNTGL